VVVWGLSDYGRCVFGSRCSGRERAASPTMRFTPAIIQVGHARGGRGSGEAGALGPRPGCTVYFGKAASFLTSTQTR